MGWKVGGGGGGGCSSSSPSPALINIVLSIVLYIFD